MRKILIAGARGLVGRAALEHFEARPGWSAIGAARRAPDFPTRADWVCVDLRDRSECERELGALRGVTHLVYAALYEGASLADGWRDPVRFLRQQRANVNPAPFRLGERRPKRER